MTLNQPPRHQHGGNLTQLLQRSGTDSLVDFSANLNPLGPPEWLRPLISAHISDLVHYPDPHCTMLTQAVADRFATILCITHVEELKDLFPFRFEVSKTAEGSRVNLIAA